jgi:hypothetical protein
MIRNLNSFLYLVVIVIALLYSGHVQSSDSTDYVALVKSRLAEMDEMDTGENWFFTTTIYTDEETLVSRNDPSKKEGARRELISVNGEPPTSERLEEFEKNEAKRLEGRENDDSRSKFSEMVDFSTLELVEVTNGQALLSFTPVLDGLEDESDKLIGSLRVNTGTHLIEELSLVNTAKLSPAFSVSLKTFNMIFLFLPVDGKALLSQMKTSIEGKAGFLKKFKESTEITFSDYYQVGKEAPFKGQTNTANRD